MDPSSGYSSGLNPGYTFETLVVGPWNRLASDAARAVAETPGSRFNPLYLCGDSGLGKTHLLHAVGQALESRQPAKHVIYTTGRRFLREFTAALIDHQGPEFRARIRNGCDALVVDDIEGLAGMELCQVEFFEIFNELCDSGRQIVITASGLPNELRGIDPRLTSRFGQGLVADIESPNPEERVAILQRWAQIDGVALPDQIAQFIATEFPGSIRALQGAFARVAAQALALNEPITPALACGALAPLLRRREELLTAEIIQQAVANYFKIKVLELRGLSRYRRISVPRQIAMYLIRKLCRLSYPDIGQRFGRKDHSSVITACRKTEQRIATDVATRRSVQHLERSLQRRLEAAEIEDGQAA